MKFIIITLLVLTLTQCQVNDDKDDLQLFLNGFFNGIGLPNPTTIMPCVDAKTAADIKTFVYPVLAQACSLSLSDIQKIIDEVQKFIDGLDPAIKICLDGNAEVNALVTKLGPLDTTKILAYVTTHFFAVRNSICGIKDAWYKPNYQDAGSKAMVLTKQVLGLKLEENLEDLPVDSYLQFGDATADLQTWLNAFFGAYGLPGPKTVLKCADTATIQKIYDFIPGSLDKACHLNVANIQAFFDYIQAFVDGLPQAAKDCLSNNAEFQALINKIGPLDEARILIYVTAHFFDVRSSACDIENTWNKKDFTKAGTDTAALLKKILGNGKKTQEIEIIEIIDIEPISA